MSVWRRSYARRKRFAARYTDPVVVIEPGDYSSMEKRIDYLKLKNNAEQRMRVHDGADPVMRQIMTACPTPKDAIFMFQQGLRTYQQVSDRIADWGINDLERDNSRISAPKKQK